MRERAGDVLGVEAPVEVDGDVDALHDRRRTFGEAPAPGGVGRGGGRRGLLGGHAAWRRPGRDASGMIWLLRGLTVVLVLCLVALGALAYGPGAPARGARIELGRGDAPAAHAIGEFTPLDVPQPAPEVGFTTRTGEPQRLDQFHGRTVLVNLWATWCAPCIREM